MAHGIILDDEPDTTTQKDAMQYDTPGFWKRVKLTSVVKGWDTTTIEVPSTIFLSLLPPHVQTHNTHTTTHSHHTHNR
jgi:hypothetical protein